MSCNMQDTGGGGARQYDPPRSKANGKLGDPEI